MLFWVGTFYGAVNGLRWPNPNHDFEFLFCSFKQKSLEALVSASKSEKTHQKGGDELGNDMFQFGSDGFEF